MPDLNQEQKDYLIDRRNKIVELREKVIDKYTPAIFENITQIRTTILSLSVTSGAIAAFSINLFDNDLVKNKVLLLIAFILFLFVVWEGYFYLKSILDKENNQLAQTTDEFNNAITLVREAIDNVSKLGTPESVVALQSAEENITRVFGNERKKIDNWFLKNISNLMLIPFTIALLLTAFSFFNFGLKGGVIMSNINILVLIAIFLLSLILGYIKYGSLAGDKSWQLKFVEIWNCFWNFFIIGLIGYYFILIRWPNLLKGEAISASDFILFAIFAMGLFGHINVLSFNITKGVEAILDRILRK